MCMAAQGCSGEAGGVLKQTSPVTPRLRELQPCASAEVAADFAGLVSPWRPVEESAEEETGSMPAAKAIERTA